MRLKLVAVALLFTLSALGQGAKVQYVTFTPVTGIQVKHGHSAPLSLAFTVAPNVHVNSNIPTSETLIPTALKLELPAGISAGKLVYPKGQAFALPFSPDEKLSVYTDAFTVKALLHASTKTKPGTYTVHGVLGYQACNDRACFPPKKLPVQFDIVVR